MSEDPLALVLRAAPHLDRVAGPGGELFLLGEDQRFVLREPLHVRLLQELDGRSSVLAIIDRLAGDFGDIEVLTAIEQMSRRGFVGPASAATESAADAWWRAAGLAAEPVLDAGAARSVDLRFAGGTAVPGLVETFESAGVIVEPGADTVLVVSEDYLDETTARTVGELQGGGSCVVPMKLAGRTIWLGPAFSHAASSDGPCWRCLRHRLERNRPVETYLARAGRERPVRRETPSLPAAQRVAASVAALKIVELLVAPQRSPLLQSLMTLDLPGLETKLHRVVRRAQCPACGDADWMRRSVAEPIRLQLQTRVPSQDGGNRVVTPEETFARCGHLVSAITGAIASLTPFEGRDHPLRPVYAAGYYLCPADAELSSNETFFRPTLGKGRTPAQARASALAETIERYASIWQGDEPSVRARRYDLGEKASPAPALLQFSAAQYAARADGTGGDWRHTAPLPFSEDAALDWVPCWSLLANARRYLPLSYCFNQVPQPREERVCPFDPNGHAAGNCREEAILQGFLELVERDAVGIWWYNRLRRPGVDAGERGSGYFAQVRESYRSLGWELWALDLTTDLEIPVIAAIGQHQATGHFVAGFGCHLDRVTALDRAVTEANQIFDPSARKTPIWTMAALQSAGDPDFVFPAPATRPPPASRWNDDTTDIRECVQFCVDRARVAGLDTIVLDYTRPDLVLSTVKVVVPGLRHVWRRLGPGRLYDVPVALGDFPEPLAEDQLNPLTLMV